MMSESFMTVLRDQMRLSHASRRGQLSHKFAWTRCFDVPDDRQFPLAISLLRPGGWHRHVANYGGRDEPCVHPWASIVWIRFCTVLSLVQAVDEVLEARETLPDEVIAALLPQGIE